MRQLETEFSLEVIEMAHTLKDANWLARNPEARAADLMQAFSDTSIKGIIATIGGDDSIRLLPYGEVTVNFGIDCHLGGNLFRSPPHQVHRRVDYAPANPECGTCNQAVGKLRETVTNSRPDWRSNHLRYAEQPE